MFYTEKKGFTLIELLVVIAIIGLLSSVILTSLNAARTKGRDANIKRGVLEFRKLLELERSEANSYDNLKKLWAGSAATCASRVYVGTYGSNATAICQNILSAMNPLQVNAFYTGLSSTIPADSQKYSIVAKLNDATTYFCVGSSGRSYEGPSDPDGTSGPIPTWGGEGCPVNP